MATKPITTIVPELVRAKEITVTAQVRHRGGLFTEGLRIRASCLEQHHQDEIYRYTLVICTLIAEAEVSSRYGFDDVCQIHKCMRKHVAF